MAPMLIFPALTGDGVEDGVLVFGDGCEEMHDVSLPLATKNGSVSILVSFADPSKT
jgi:hypothetical protein